MGNRNVGYWPSLVWRVINGHLFPFFSIPHSVPRHRIQCVPRYYLAPFASERGLLLRLAINDRVLNASNWVGFPKAVAEGTQFLTDVRTRPPNRFAWRIAPNIYVFSGKDGLV